MEYRSLSDFEVRADGDGRTLAGIAVPWGKKIGIGGQQTEEFVRGAFAHQIESGAGRVILTSNHMVHGGVPIGVIKAMRDDSKGLHVEARVSKTQAGDETLELLKDGALSNWSIGFRPVTNEAVGSHVRRVKANLFELAVVPEGAYGDRAAVSTVRAAGACPECGHDPAGRLIRNEVELIQAALREIRSTF